MELNESNQTVITITFEVNLNEQSETELNQSTTERFQNLLLERQYFENRVYDYLVTSPFLFVPEHFWDPVKVSLTDEQINTFVELNQEDECIICTTNHNTFRELKCCKNKLCIECTNKWFHESVKCPFCVKDLRELI